MYILESTDIFNIWFAKLRDYRAKAKILTKLKKIELGNLGDYKFVGKGVSEFRITHGPGYRIYYTLKGNNIILLLIGGDKSTQSKDIKKAQQLLNKLEK